jgi:group I intron endonuclease
MRKKGNPGVYIIQNKVNNKVYIGASKDTYNRLCMHKWRLRVNTHDNLHLQSAFNKYKEENFTFDVLEECEEQYIYSQENYWCNLLNSHNRLFGYNVDPTAPDGKCAVSSETRIRMSNGASKRSIDVYTIYGNYYQSFTDLYTCADHFSTVAPNIHRKMNVLFFKKNLIDSLSSKYIFVDSNSNVEEVRLYWDNIFEQIKSGSGKYTVHDCFDNYIGQIDSSRLSKILNVTLPNISGAVRRNTYLRTLKLSK